MVVVEAGAQLVLIVRLPDARGHKGVGVPVGQIRVFHAAVVLGLLTVAAAVDELNERRIAGDKAAGLTCCQSLNPGFAHKTVKGNVIFIRYNFAINAM